MENNLLHKKLLDKINDPGDVKKFLPSQLDKLALEIRQVLIENVSSTGGHLASNLGVVELTLALHHEFNTPKDKIVWDVGHQSYVHKLLTGRKDKFYTLRQSGGISGFPKVNESCHDCFNTGHSSTSISAALGFARSRDIKKENHSVIAVIGDGALTGGMAFEALNDAGRSFNNLIVILNDNEMSISKNVGGLSSYLSKIRTEPIYYKVKEDINEILNKIPAIGKSASKALDTVKGTIKYTIMPGVIFEELGFKYLGPIDGHNISDLCTVLRKAKNLKGPVFIHVNTQKGKGYTHAEEKPQDFHGVSPFEIETGEVKSSGGKTFSDIFGQELVKHGELNKKIVAITAAMPNGTGLDSYSRKFPERFFDVGIAEQHAVTFAAGLAQDGLVPVFAVYSSFLQRAIDQVIHDVAISNLHVVLGIDRSGIVGEDGETHQGIYDVSLLNSVPNMSIIMPADYREFKEMLDYALNRHNGPIAVRYPRGKGMERLYEYNNDEDNKISYGKGVIVKEGRDMTIAAAGTMVETALNAAQILEKEGLSVEVINPRFIKPLDESLIINSVQKTGWLATLEENTIVGGFGSSVMNLLNRMNIKMELKVMGLPDQFILQGCKKDILKKYELDSQSVASRLLHWKNTKKTDENKNLKIKGFFLPKRIYGKE